MRKREKKISFWATKSEKNQIEKLARSSGLGMGEYLRSVSLGKKVYRISELKPTLRELKSIGNNLNQLTVLSHEGRIKAINLDSVLASLRQNFTAISNLFGRDDVVISRPLSEETPIGDV